MLDDRLIKNAVDLIVLINTAITNVRFYPPGSELILHAIGRIDAFLTGMLKYLESVEYGEFERTLLFQGEPLPEKEQRKPPVKAFLKILLEWKIRGVVFQKGASKRELTDFIQIISGTPDDAKDDAALARLLDTHKILHIKIDRKIYTVRDEDQSIVAGFSLRDEDVAKTLLGDQPLTDELLDALRDLAKDPEWLAKVFTSGVNQLMESAKAHSGDLSGLFASMTASFESISEYEKSELAGYLLSAATDMSDDAFLTILTQDMTAVFGDNFLNVLVGKADDVLFEKFVGRVRHMVDTALTSGRMDRPRIVTNRQLTSLMKTIKSAQALAVSQHTPEGAQPSASEKDRAGKLAAALSGIVKCPAMVSHERIMLDRMEETVKNLLANHKYDAISALFGQLGNLLQNRDAEIRTSAVNLLANIDEQFETADRLAERIHLSRKIVEWMGNETEFSPVYEKVSTRLQGFTRILVEKKYFREALPVLEVCFSIARGALPKNENILNLSRNYLKNLADEDLLNRYLREMQPGGALPGEEDMRGLVILGSANVDRLLDLLHDSHSRQERNAIVRVITGIGKPAAQLVTERIGTGGPWFYIRNLTLLLGRVGDASHLPVLEGLLKDKKNPRIQREAVLAVQHIGGPAGARLLHQYFYEMDDDLKILMISGFGHLKYHGIAKELIAMLESGPPAKSKKAKTDMTVRICEALGRMGEIRAVKVLERIAHPKGFLAKSFDPLVRTAAEEALQKINKISSP